MADNNTPDPLASKTAQRAAALAAGTNRTPAQQDQELAKQTPADEPAEVAPEVVAPDLDAPADEE